MHTARMKASNRGQSGPDNCMAFSLAFSLRLERRDSAITPARSPVSECYRFVTAEAIINDYVFDKKSLLQGGLCALPVVTLSMINTAWFASADLRTSLHS